MLVAGRGVVSGVMSSRKGQRDEPLAPHLIAHSQPLLLPDALRGDAIVAGDPVLIADAGGQIGCLIGQEGKGGYSQEAISVTIASCLIARQERARRDTGPCALQTERLLELADTRVLSGVPLKRPLPAPSANSIIAAAVGLRSRA